MSAAESGPATIGRAIGDISFMEALPFDNHDPSLVLQTQDLGTLAFPSPPTTSKTSFQNNDTPSQKANTSGDSPRSPPVENKVHFELKRSPSRTKPPLPVKSKSMSNMATHRPEAQCLELCRKLILFIDQVSIPVLEYLTSSKQHAEGFEPLAHDFLEASKALFTIEAGLKECTRTKKSFPQTMMAELNQKFRSAQVDLQALEHLLGKILSTTNSKKWGWGKIFGETDIKKMANIVSRTRDSLNQSAMVFRYSLGTVKVERELGIGLTGLTAALRKGDRKDMDTIGRARSMNGNVTQYKYDSISNELNSGRHIDAQQQVQNYQQQPQHQFSQAHVPASASWSSIPASPARDVSHATEYSGDVRSFTSQDHAAYTNLGNRPPGFKSVNSSDTYHSSVLDRSDRTSMIDDTGTTITESSSILRELSAMDLIDSTKVVRHQVDPTTMPRIKPRSFPGSESADLISALASAVRVKNHKLMEQLLDRGVPANTGHNMHALNEAVFAHDAESVRLLLLYGANPNTPDRDGVTPLLASVDESFLSGATLLLKYGADPNLPAGGDLESPLAVAVKANRIGMSHLLLTYNGDANLVTANGETLLIGAINKKIPEKFIDVLLNYGSQPNAKSREGKTPLFEAIQVGRADIVTRLLEHGADPNLPGPKHMLWPATYQSACLQVLLSYGATPKKCPGIMELAASINNIESVRILLKAGVNPNTKKDGVYTPLCTSIRDDRPELLQLLLASGADPNVPASEYPAFKCVTHDRIHFLPTLVTAGADLHSPKGIVETAVSFKNLEALNWLLDQGVSPNDRNSKGMSPLTTAIREDRIDIVDLLLLRGADPNQRGENWPICMAVKNPPILRRLLSVLTEPRAFKGVMEMAVSANQLESVKLLIAAGVSVEDKNGGVFSPLTTAIRENRRDIVTYLITDGGANINSPGEHLPIVKALRRFHGEGDTEILEMLLARGADPNKMYRGWNAIMQAVENGEESVLRMVCSKAGVDLSVTDEMGRNVVQMAASRAWDEAVKILEKGNTQFLAAASKR